MERLHCGHDCGEEYKEAYTVLRIILGIPKCLELTNPVK